MKLRIGKSIIPFLSVVFISCGAAPPDAEVFRIPESAASEVIESHAPSWQPGEEWRLSSSPILEIGVEDGEIHYLFSGIVGAIRLDDGRIVVADRGSNQVRIFDERGEFIRAVGGEGKGPGEFEHIRGLSRCGADSIFAFDLNWQTKIFDLAGELVREMRIHEPGSMGGPYALSCSRTGHFVITGWGEQTSIEARMIGLYRATAPISILDRDGELLLDLGEFPSSERIGHQHGSNPHPFGKSTVLALGPERVYVGTGDVFEIMVYSFDGELVRLIRGPAEDLQIRSEHLAAYRRQRISQVDAARRPALERELQEMPMPRTFPAFSALRLDTDGNLWVRKFRRPLERQPIWAVFSPEGGLLGEVVMPAGLGVMEIGSDYVLGVQRDDFGIERVLLYYLEKD